MSPGAILGGLVLVGIGGFVVGFPMRVRSFATARTWQTDPERAERYQRAFAYAFGAFVVAIGIAFILFGLLAG